jgi:uncharacterized protein
MKKAMPVMIGFALLFIIYHAAEYMIMFKNSPAGFLGLQALFFITAWLIAKWQFKTGLSSWGLDTKKRLFMHLGLGMMMGLVLYGLTFFISLLTGAETINTVPGISALAAAFGLFVFGNFFSSFSEDILTRGYVYKHLHGKIGNGFLGLLSAIIYVLNHIYRLNEGVETLLYLFALGVVFVVPLLLTKRLWFTSGMHWAGNCFFYLTHELIKTGSPGKALSPNYILVLCILIVLPVNYYLLKRCKMIERRW